MPNKTPVLVPAQGIQPFLQWTTKSSPLAPRGPAVLPQLQDEQGHGLWEKHSHFHVVCLPCHISSQKAALIAELSFVNRSELPLKKEQSFFKLNGGLILQGSAKTAIITLRMTVVCTEKVAQFFPKKNELSNGNQHAQSAGHEGVHYQSF